MSSIGETTRRDFLIQLSSLGIVLSHPMLMRTQDQLPTRAIPTSGETVPVIGLGSTKPVLEIPTAGTAPLESVIRTLIRYGGRVVDTAPRTEDIDAEFGRLLQDSGLGNRLFLAIKINATLCSKNEKKKAWPRLVRSDSRTQTTPLVTLNTPIKITNCPAVVKLTPFSWDR